MLKVVCRPDLWEVLNSGQSGSRHAEDGSPDVEFIWSNIGENGRYYDDHQCMHQGYHGHQQRCLPSRGFPSKLFIGYVRRVVAEENEKQYKARDPVSRSRL